MEPIKFALLGSSRGLGKSFNELLIKKGYSSTEIYQASRKMNQMDFSQKSNWDSYLLQLAEQNPEKIIYFAAGGPYGEFQKPEWKDHEWALNVTFLFPAYLLHQVLDRKKFPALKQVTFIGSSVAESEPDPKASMYSASKHALKGLVTSVKKENPGLDLRLFSPGYMDTPLLPANAWPRKQNLVRNPTLVAEELLSFISG